MSNDPAADAVIFVIGTIVTLAVIIGGVLFFTPIALGILAVLGIAKAIHWYIHLPPSLAKVPRIATQELKQVQFPTPEQFIQAHLTRLTQMWGSSSPPPSFWEQIAYTADTLYTLEDLSNPLPPLPLKSDVIERGKYLDVLNERAKRSADPHRTLSIINNALGTAFNNLIQHLPQPLRTTYDALDKPVTVPFVDLLANPGNATHDVISPFFTNEISELHLFKELRLRLDMNLCDVSGVSYPAPVHKLTLPHDYKGPPQELVHQYLKGTPLEQLFYIPVPFQIPEETRFSGQWVIAPPGRGKTVLLSSMFLDDIKRDASIIVMDSKGDLINPIKELQAIKDRVVLIEPDENFPLALNPLDIPKTNITHTISLLEYVFSSLLEAKMTALQVTLFRSVLRALVEAVPNPTLETFRDMIVNGVEPYKQHFAKLAPDLQDFFKNDFDSKTYTDTRNQITWRLRFLMDNPVIRSMFTAMKTKLDLGKEMDAGKVIIVNNSKAMLGDSGAEFFGRFFIALVLAAAQQRSNRRPQDKKPCFFYIDECQSVISRDEKIPTILDECRSQKIALILAHQRSEQITSPNVLSALQNCAIRFANSDDEAKQLAPKLRTTPEFLYSLPKGTFAAFVRDLTLHALALKIPFTDLTKLPRITHEERKAIRERMRANYTVDVPKPPPTPQTLPTPSAPPPAPETTVTLNPRPSELEPWRLDSADKKPDPHTGDHTEPADKWGKD